MMNGMVFQLINLSTPGMSSRKPTTTPTSPVSTTSRARGRVSKEKAPKAKVPRVKARIPTSNATIVVVMDTLPGNAPIPKVPKARARARLQGFSSSKEDSILEADS